MMKYQPSVSYDRPRPTSGLASLRKNAINNSYETQSEWLPTQNTEYTNSTSYEGKKYYEEEPTSFSTKS